MRNNMQYPMFKSLRQKNEEHSRSANQDSVLRTQMMEQQMGNPSPISASGNAGGYDYMQEYVQNRGVTQGYADLVQRNKDAASDRARLGRLTRSSMYNEALKNGGFTPPSMMESVNANLGTDMVGGTVTKDGDFITMGRDNNGKLVATSITPAMEVLRDLTMDKGDMSLARGLYGKLRTRYTDAQIKEATGYSPDVGTSIKQQQLQLDADDKRRNFVLKSAELLKNMSKGKDGSKTSPVDFFKSLASSGLVSALLKQKQYEKDENGNIKMDDDGNPIEKPYTNADAANMIKTIYNEAMALNNGGEVTDPMESRILNALAAEFNGIEGANAKTVDPVVAQRAGVLLSKEKGGVYRTKDGNVVAGNYYGSGDKIYDANGNLIEGAVEGNMVNNKFVPYVNKETPTDDNVAVTNNTPSEQPALTEQANVEDPAPEVKKVDVSRFDKYKVATGKVAAKPDSTSTASTNSERPIVQIRTAEEADKFINGKQRELERRRANGKKIMKDMEDSKYEERTSITPEYDPETSRITFKAQSKKTLKDIPYSGNWMEEAKKQAIAKGKAKADARAKAIQDEKDYEEFKKSEAHKIMGFDDGVQKKPIIGKMEDMYRPDGTIKGNGWLGNVSKDKNIAITEFSIRDAEDDGDDAVVDKSGKYIDYPTLVPGLTDKEIDTVRSAANGDNNVFTTKEWASVVRKAKAHAKMRIAQGKSVWADEDYNTPKMSAKQEPKLKKGFSPDEKEMLDEEGRENYKKLTEARKIMGYPEEEPKKSLSGVIANDFSPRLNARNGGDGYAYSKEMLTDDGKKRYDEIAEALRILGYDPSDEEGILSKMFKDDPDLFKPKMVSRK